MSITNQLALFVDVVQQGSFAKAAALNDMDNSSLSKQIKKLESSFVCNYLTGLRARFSLTSAGDEILQQAHILRPPLAIFTVLPTRTKPNLKAFYALPRACFGQQYIQPVINIFMQKYPE
ncbi:LysR family transcriptional regulator (plasmid) [Pseudoalteromonas espejiana]